MRNYPCDNAVENNNSKPKKICKEILNYNTGTLELLDILICLLFNSKADNLKTVQLQKAAISEHGPILKLNGFEC